MKKLRGSNIVIIIALMVVVGFTTTFNVILVKKSSFYMEFKEARIINGLENSTIEPMDIEVVGELITKKFDIAELWKSNAILGTTNVYGTVDIDGLKYELILMKSNEGGFGGYLTDGSKGKDKFKGYIFIDENTKRICLFDYEVS